MTQIFNFDRTWSLFSLISTTLWSCKVLPLGVFPRSRSLSPTQIHLHTQWVGRIITHSMFAKQNLTVELESLRRKHKGYRHSQSTQDRNESFTPTSHLVLRSVCKLTFDNESAGWVWPILLPRPGFTLVKSTFHRKKVSLWSSMCTASSVEFNFCKPAAGNSKFSRHPITAKSEASR